MGLAASQARFLAVTSRKSSCEFRSLELAQEKLSLTSEMDDAAAEYQEALNATRLVWDAEGIGGDGDYRFELSYDIMMNPSDYNQYTPYLLSRQDGKIALDKKIVDAIYDPNDPSSAIFNYDPETGTCDGGIWYNGRVVYRGDVDYQVAQYEAFDKFIDNMRTTKAISSATADKMQSDSGYMKYTYIPNAGVGAELLGREKSNMMTANSMMSYIDYIVDNSLSGYFTYDSEEWKLAENLIFDFEKHDYVLTAAEKREHSYSEDVGAERYNLEGVLDDDWKSTKGNTYLFINGSYANDSNYLETEQNAGGGLGVAQYSASAFTLADLLNEDVTLLVNDKTSLNSTLDAISEMITGVSNLGSSACDLINLDVDQWYDKIMRKDGAYKELITAAQKNSSVPGDTASNNAKSSLAVLNFIDKLAKSMYALLMPEDPTTEDSNAFYVALTNTISRFRNANDNSGKYYDSDYVTLNSSNTRSEAFAKQAVNSADDYNTWVKYGGEWAISLSNVTEAFLTDFVNGMDSYQNGCLITKNAKSSTYITDYSDYMYTVNTVDEAETGLWESEFYSVLFNNICANGCYLNEQVNDKVYLDNALKNGQLFIASKGNDNYYYQSRYTDVSGGHITIETDTAAIAVAEREYSYKKSQINFKEEQIEIETKQLDAEISSLTTEMETIKTLIKTNIEKSFKMFSS